ncbi:hypothetical protein [Pseudomonas sp. 2FG]|uniref:hypothetical protein n=1 Tax=Pseudomonas sp. 2FG TaxID=2502191 RepID=UPI0010F89676|nr:hypothetical protein [Pseudomonas sp. 2FG]
MKAWLGLALLAVATVLGVVWLSRPAAAPVAAVPLPPRAAEPTRSLAAPQPSPSADVADFSVTAVPLSLPAEPAQVEPARLSAEEAVTLMQLMAEQGDPRSPALQPSQPRAKAPAAALADPARYAQFEDRQSREQIQAYAAGVQKIPEIRERIEQAAQSGERNAEELDEARAALEQLEMLQSQLQHQAPQLLPSAP